MFGKSAFLSKTFLLYKEHVASLMVSQLPI